jgi:hypothetical protein
MPLRFFRVPQSEAQLTRRYAMFWVVLLAVFLGFCWHYATRMNLWGDEAFSLLAAGLGWGQVPQDVHLPTYYWLLGALLRVVDERQELLLRMFHAIPFTVGLGFGGLTLHRSFGERRLVMLVLAMAIALPNYLFFAVSLRMYSLQFMTSMAFIDAVSRLLTAKPEPSRQVLLWLGLSGLALVCTNYSNVIYYVAGVAMVGLYSLTHKRWLPLVIVAIPGLVLGWLISLTAGNLAKIQQFDLAGYQGTESLSLSALAKELYLACRPALDLIYPAPLPLPLALGLPLVLLAVLLAASWRLWQQRRGWADATVWVILLALWWVPFMPTGYSFTRLFLPSQLFMVAVMVWWVLSATHWLRYVGWASLGLMAFLNLGQAMAPTLRLYDLPPYKTIAADLVAVYEQTGVDQILLGNNSLNTLAIDHYLQQLTAPGTVPTRRVDAADLEAALAENPATPVMFVSHMGESGGFIDVAAITDGNAQLLDGYVSLAELPYNRLWQQRYRQGAGQSHMVQTYVIAHP